MVRDLPTREEDPVPLPEELKDVLACPRCKGVLDVQEARARLVCRACALVFRIEGGDLPVLLLEEATPLEGEGAS